MLPLIPPDPHAAPCAVAIGASAGGVKALRTIITALPADLPAAVFIVLHLDPNGRSLLPSLLAAATSLRVRDVRDAGVIERGTVYVAIPDRHLLVSDGRLRLTVSERVHHVRPSVDRLFESIALNWLTAAVGIAAIKHGGGHTIAQDPSEAEYSSMPRAAIATGSVDAVLPLLSIAPAVAHAAALAAAGRAA